jgi:hypothetical protein
MKENDGDEANESMSKQVKACDDVQGNEVGNRK